MRLRDYLEARGESQRSFAARAGTSQQVISLICKGGSCRLETADRVIRASRHDPAPCGGTVTYADLVNGAQPRSKLATSPRTKAKRDVRKRAAASA